MLHEGGADGREPRPAAKTDKAKNDSTKRTMSDEASGSASAPKRPAARLTLEEKLWFDRRKSDLEQYAAFGAGIGAVIAAGVTCTSPLSPSLHVAARCRALGLQCV